MSIIEPTPGEWTIQTDPWYKTAVLAPNTDDGFRHHRPTMVIAEIVTGNGRSSKEAAANAHLMANAKLMRDTLAAIESEWAPHSEGGSAGFVEIHSDMIEEVKRVLALTEYTEDDDD